MGSGNKRRREREVDVIGNCATALKESKGEDKREVDVIMKLCYSLS